MLVGKVVLMSQPTMASALIRPEALTPHPSSGVERGRRMLLLALAILTGVAWLLTLWHIQFMAMPFGGPHEGGTHHGNGLGLQETAQLAAVGMASTGLS